MAPELVVYGEPDKDFPMPYEGGGCDDDTWLERWRFVNGDHPLTQWASPDDWELV